MFQLIKDQDKLHDMINPRPTSWENVYGTNCYAYALGLDIPEKEIAKDAYSYIGTMGFCHNKDDLHKTNIITRLEFDLDFLGLKFEESSPFALTREDEWLIALFSSKFNENDFHFARKDVNTFWMHKPGWMKVPINTDDNEKIIENIDKATFDKYDFEKCLKLRK